MNNEKMALFSRDLASSWWRRATMLEERSCNNLEISTNQKSQLQFFFLKVTNVWWGVMQEKLP
jgi:hypothetical protein